MKKKTIITSVCILILFAAFVGMFWYSHPTHYRYNDRFVLGRGAEEITQKYGEFSKEWVNEDTGELTRAFYRIRDNTPDLGMEYDDSLWYEIHFKDGVATEVRLQHGWYGG